MYYIYIKKKKEIFFIQYHGSQVVSLFLNFIRAMAKHSINTCQLPSTAGLHWNPNQTDAIDTDRSVLQRLPTHLLHLTVMGGSTTSTLTAHDSHAMTYLATNRQKVSRLRWIAWCCVVMKFSVRPLCLFLVRFVGPEVES
jgi:hypothetical protein